ncbi:MAG: NAD-dependent epimerase/dehydratase family protein [Acidobacteriaceae bacterium]|nr:NAD-dependent epimerase/dehydratase family protein [Acidobacteriaceae bacterium]MBV9679946.1 NAD-dependent epimerase/dehydratase family protein [Acidobacteriaceae bacterium]
MRILITGICGFVGNRLARVLPERLTGIEITGIDNLLRPGSELNRQRLAEAGCRVIHGDLRMRSDVESLPACDWVIDAAANPSVLAGVDGKSSPRQLNEHNLTGTLNILEYCRLHRAGLILLSTSRVYSLRDLAALPTVVQNQAFALDGKSLNMPGVTVSGVTENFSTKPPISLYGATKLASEVMAREYGFAFDFPVWINRCGVLAGAGQFGTAEQGIFSYWLHAHAARLRLRYIGFGGQGYQVRDAFHPDDLADLLAIEMERDPPADAIFNAGGGPGNAMSLAQLTEWCDKRFGAHGPEADERPRAFDIPWFVMNNDRVRRELGWSPRRSLSSILEEIAEHVRAHPDWLKRCASL